MEKIKIMIIDDELEIIDALQRFLSRSGKMDVTINSNPEVALKNIQSENYDLVLCDIMMPMINGMKVLETIKGSHPGIKVILMTAYSTEKKKDQANQLHVDGYLEKPFPNLKQIEELILNTINK